MIMGRKDKIVPLQNIASGPLGTWMRHERQQKGINLTQMAQKVGYSKSYVSSVENNMVKPSQDLLESYEKILQLHKGAFTSQPGEEHTSQSRRRPQAASPKILYTPKMDVDEAPHVTPFHGRKEQLATLKRWIVSDRCHLVPVLGFGGVGKTVLASQLIHLVKQDFEYVSWLSLKDAPSLETVLEKFLTFFSDYQSIGQHQNAEDWIKHLIQHLQEHRCLLLLDNFESLLQSGTLAGQFRDDYKDYGLLLQRIGETQHQSCVLLTSREKPGEILRMEGKMRPTRSMELRGVEKKEGKALLEGEELFGSDQTWAEFIEQYKGNPLTLKLVAGIIREMFGGDIARFLQRGEFVYSGGIKELLDQQFQRLSAQEQNILFWLAIEREGVSSEELEHACMNMESKEILTVLNSLYYRSLIEAYTIGGVRRYTLQPVIMEYVTDQIVERTYNEIIDEKPEVFTSHALIKAQAEDYIRNNQLRLILDPVKRRLLTFSGKDEIESKLKRILATLRKDTPEYAAGNILNLLIRLEVDLRDYDFSHLAVWQAYLRGAKLQNIDFTASDLSRSIFTDTFGSVLSVTYHPHKENNLLAIGTATCEVRIYQAGIPLTICQGHKDWVRSVAFSSDGNTILSGSDDQTIRLWNVASGQCNRTLYGHTGQVYSVAISSDRRTLASGSEDQSIRLWDMNTGQCRQILHGHTGAVRSVVFSPDSTLLVSAGDDQIIRIWNVETGACSKELSGHSMHIYSVAFSPDGRTLASGGEDQIVRIWDVESGQQLQSLEKHDHWIYSVAFSPDGHTLASGSEDQTVRLWDMSTGQCIRTLSGHNGGVWSVAFSADGQSITSGSDDQKVLSWKTSSGQGLQTLQGHSSRVCAISTSKDGKLLGSGGDDQMVRIWDTASGQLLKTLSGHSGRIWSLAFNADGTTVASGSEDQTILLWSIINGLCLKQFRGHEGRVYCISFSPDKSLIASGGDDHTVRIWDADTGECLKIYTGHEKRVYCITFSPDGSLLASGSDDQSIRLWDTATSQCIRTIRAQSGRIWSVAFSPDGTLVASGSDDQNVHLWDRASGQCSKILEGHSGTVWAVTFLQKGETLISGGDDQSIRLWNTTTGQCLQTLNEHFRVRSLTSSPDSSTIASCGNYEGTITRWDIKQQARIDKLKSERPYEGVNISGVKGLTEAQKASFIALGAIEGVSM
jgi:WD40 repeat protein/transcriptional regulator with XRE-family HTH domain